jgi:hypothetical protein
VVVNSGLTVVAKAVRKMLMKLITVVVVTAFADTAVYD